MSTPKISILMGVYNAESSVESAVLSIEQQTVTDFEFLICDDGSTDGTWNLLCCLSDQFENIVLLRNEYHKGLAYSLNRCIEVSRGTYFARMDADDTCLPDRFEQQLKFLEAHPEFDLVGTQCIFVYDDGKKYFFDKPEYPTADVLPLKTPFVHPTVMFRRRVFEKLGGYNVSEQTMRCEDLELWYRFFNAGLKGYNLQSYLYNKRQGKVNYQQRTFRYGFDIFKVHISGMKMLHMKWYRYLLAVKPIISSIVPKRIMMIYHKIILGEFNL